jgi:glutaminyl-peptide cyclotransferase
MQQRRVIPHWRDLQLLAGGYLLWILGPVVLAFVIVPFALWTRSNVANAAANPVPAPIDGDRAYKYLKAICALGPRPAGSEANARQRAMVAKHFQTMGGKVREQRFTGIDPMSGARVEMANLIGSWHPERTKRVLLSAHYDTRPFPDEEQDPARRSIPFIGANDGASGVALLMEIAHHLKDLPTPWGVDLVLFDGEELVYGREGEYFLGSKEFARAYVEEVDAKRSRHRYVAGLVLDMVGGRNLQIKQEPYSLDFVPRLVQDVWSVAKRLKATAFSSRVGRAVLDDHLPLNNGGIPAIDIIDFDYPYWHTSRDLPENCSGASLAQVGRVLTAWLSQPQRR